MVFSTFPLASSGHHESRRYRPVMTAEKDIHRVLFNISLAESSLKALELLDRLMQLESTTHLPADVRRELRLAAATVLRVRELDVEEELSAEVTSRLQEVRERLAQGEKLTKNDFLNAIANRPPRAKPTRTASSPDHSPAHTWNAPTPSTTTPDLTPASPTPIDPLLGSLISTRPTPAANLRATAGASTARPAPTTTQPLKHARPPPPMMAA